MTTATLADTGTFSGYLASFTPDHEGDVIMGAAAVADSVAAVNAGRMTWHLTDSHSDRASDVVATVTHAAVDADGVLVQARWAPTAAAQNLRAMARAGHQLGMSIDYTADASAPNTRGGRDLARIMIHGGAIVTHPMNSMCRIVESKAAETGRAAPEYTPIIDVYADAQERRRDPGRERKAAEDELLAGLDWPPRHWDRSLRLGVLAGCAEAKAARLPADDSDRLAAERMAREDAYSRGLRRAMAAGRDRAGCRCQRCRWDIPGCVYG